MKRKPCSCLVAGEGRGRPPLVRTPGSLQREVELQIGIQAAIPWRPAASADLVFCMAVREGCAGAEIPRIVRSILDRERVVDSSRGRLELQTISAPRLKRVSRRERARRIRIGVKRELGSRNVAVVYRASSRIHKLYAQRIVSSCSSYPSRAGGRTHNGTIRSCNRERFAYGGRAADCLPAADQRLNITEPLCGPVGVDQVGYGSATVIVERVWWHEFNPG